jgi:hypothetical protein
LFWAAKKFSWRVRHNMSNFREAKHGLLATRRIKVSYRFVIDPALVSSYGLAAMHSRQQKMRRAGHKPPPTQNPTARPPFPPHPNRIHSLLHTRTHDKQIHKSRTLYKFIMLQGALCERSEKARGAQTRASRVCHDENEKERGKQIAYSARFPQNEKHAGEKGPEDIFSRYIKRRGWD